MDHKINHQQMDKDFAGPKCSEGERSEPERNEGPAKAAQNHNRPAAPDPEVSEKPFRRRFSVQYKARIVEQADKCSEQGQIGALLRREL